MNTNNSCFNITLKDGNVFTIDIENENDWGNIQRCFTDWDGKKQMHRECVGFGDAEDWVEIIDVENYNSKEHIEPMKWATEFVWDNVNKFTS